MTIARTLLLLSTLAGAVSVAAQNTAQQAPAPAVASTPAAAAGSAQAPTLGRLFFTPAERAHLDELRRKPVPRDAVTSESDATPAVPSPQYITVNGVVRRSDGTTTVWVNNKPVAGKRVEDGVVVTPSGGSGSGNVTVRIAETGHSVNLKVGQQLELHSGQVQDAYASPRAVAPAAGATAAEARVQERTTSAFARRRSNRERDLLRELMHEIDGPAQAAPAPKPSAQTPPGSESAGIPADIAR